jgi:hypothetical protein
MKNLKICALVIFSMTSILLSAQDKKVRASTYSKANAEAKPNNNILNAMYTVNPSAFIKESVLRNEGTQPTTYTKTLVAQGSGYTKGGVVKAECSCRYGNTYDYVSEPNMTFQADSDGNFDFKLVALLKEKMVSCNTKLTDMKTGKIAQYVWFR